MHEWLIRCLECEADILEEKLKAPANLTKDQVLEHAEHLEECDVPGLDGGMLDVRSEAVDSLTIYTIKILRQ